MFIASAPDELYGTFQIFGKDKIPILKCIFLMIWINIGYIWAVSLENGLKLSYN